MNTNLEVKKVHFKNEFEANFISRMQRVLEMQKLKEDLMEKLKNKVLSYDDIYNFFYTTANHKVEKADIKISRSNALPNLALKGGATIPPAELSLTIDSLLRDAVKGVREKKLRYYLGYRIEKMGRIYNFFMEQATTNNYFFSPKERYRNISITNAKKLAVGISNKMLGLSQLEQLVDSVKGLDNVSKLAKCYVNKFFLCVSDIGIGLQQDKNLNNKLVEKIFSQLKSKRPFLCGTFFRKTPEKKTKITLEGKHHTRSIEHYLDRNNVLTELYQRPRL